MNQLDLGEQEAITFPPVPTGEEINLDLPVVDLREVHWQVSGQTAENLTQPHIQSQLNRIGYGSKGFERFQVEVPNKLRSQAVRLRFRLFGDTVAYIDNIFLQSEHLKFGNLSEARTFKNAKSDNYLLEKPQYAVSYNDDLKTPNWVSYKLDPSWVEGTTPPRPNFGRDYRLPFDDAVEEDYQGSGYIRGHLVPNNDRLRVTESYYEAKPKDTADEPNYPTGEKEKYLIKKDNFQTFSLTNIVPQYINDTAWQQLENRPLAN